MPSPQHRIFISHSHIDNGFGSKLAQDLHRALGDEQAVWYDVLGGLHGGESWWEKIVEELTARDIFLLILSPEALNSQWVRREINIAMIEGKYILPVLHRSCTIRADLRTFQIISFLAPKSYQEALQEVLVALGLPTNTPAPIEHKAPVQPANDFASVLLQQIETAFSDQDWPDVIRKADYLITHMHTNASSTVYRLQGLAYLEEGDMPEAQKSLETALALVSDRQQRLTLLSDYTALLAQQQQWPKVLQRSREALRLLPNDPGWLATQQQAQNQLTQPTSAPKPAPTPQKTKEQWVEEARKLIDLKQYEEALTAAEQAIRLDPNYAPAYNNKGGTLVNLKRFEEALAACDQAIRLDPNFALAYNNKGLAFYGLQRYEEAITAFDQAIRLDPDFAPAYNNKGTALWTLKRFKVALDAYEQAIHLNPSLAFAHYGKGSSLYYLKRYEEALYACEQAIRLDPNYANAYYNKGIVLEQLGRAEEAQQAYEKAKQLGFRS